MITDFKIFENISKGKILKNTINDLYSWFFKTFPDMNINYIEVGGAEFDKILTPVSNIPKGSDISVNFSVPMNGNKYYDLSLYFTRNGEYMKRSSETDEMIGKYADDIFSIIQKNLN
jgi:hypothetical protein